MNDNQKKQIADILKTIGTVQLAGIGFVAFNAEPPSHAILILSTAIAALLWFASVEELSYLKRSDEEG